MTAMTFARANYFWLLSALVHLILFLLVCFFSFNYHLPAVVSKENDQSYYYYVPAYTPASTSQFSQTTAQPVDNLVKEKNKIEQSPKVVDKTYDLSRVKPAHKYDDWAKQANALRQLDQQNSINQTDAKYEEAIHLVGDKFLDDPLRKLLGKAITAHIYYPDVARELNLRGVVSIELVLNPDGNITGAHVVKSSRERILDAAAANAINAASPINGVDLYVREPKHLAINIIF